MAARTEHGQGRWRWLAGVVAPWALAAGWLVSFTATAGIELPAGATAVAGYAARTVPALPSGVALVQVAAAILPPLGATFPESRDLRFRFDLTAGPETFALRPRSELKTRARIYPLVDRSRKGDPLVALRTTLSRRAADLPRGGAMFGGAAEGGLAAAFVPGPATWGSDLEAEQVFVPWTPEDKTTTDAVGGASSPPSGSSTHTGTGLRRDRALDGSTPAVPRATTLSSTTPAPADAIPVEVAAGAVSFPTTPRVIAPGVTGVARGDAAGPPDGARPRYADLVRPETLEKEQRCLAEAVYFEARSEPQEGQAAVAQVVLNRAKSGLYPSNICGVVYQNRHRYMGCQFSFACEGKSLRIADSESWSTATRVAHAVLEGRTYLADVGGATHYHADYVRPNWSRRLKRMDAIGRHIFYKLKAGQT